jgi:alpha-amylase
MINFEFKYDAKKTMNLYSQSTHYSEELKGNTVLNYLSSHDDGGPLTPNEPKLLKQVQNFYFLRNCSGILW